MSGNERLEEMQAILTKLARREAVLVQVLMLKQAEITNDSDPEELKGWLSLSFEDVARAVGDIKAQRKRVAQLHEDRLKSLGVVTEPAQSQQSGR